MRDPSLYKGNSPYRHLCVLQAGRDDNDGEDAGGAERGGPGMGSAPGCGRSSTEEEGEGEPAGGEERGPPLELFGADNPDRTDMPGGSDYRGPPSEWEEGDPEGPPGSDWDEEDPDEAQEGADALEALGEGGEGEREEFDEDGLYTSEVRNALRRAGHLALLHYREARLEAVSQAGVSMTCLMKGTVPPVLRVLASMHLPEHRCPFPGHAGMHTNPGWCAGGERRRGRGR